MKVTLIAQSGPYPPERIVGASARSCYSVKPSEQLIREMSDEAVSTTLGLTHGSTYEHAVFTFCIEGISRACSHQLVRHRLASYSQQSQRYVSILRTWEDIVLPPMVQAVIDEEDELGDTRRDEHLLNAIDTYKDALSSLLTEMEGHGIPSEDLRYFIPQGTRTNITVTMNARELLQFFVLRMCNRAQWEIRDVASAMYDLVKDCPLFSHGGPACEQLGYCPEHRPCGKCPTLDQIREGRP